MKSIINIPLRLALTIVVAATMVASATAFEGAVPNDNTNAVLWNQGSPEFQGNSVTIFKAAEMLLDRALVDRNWTAATEQTGDFQSKPPAVILDIDETVLDNSDYQAWLVKEGKSFDAKTWNSFVKSVTSRAVPGSLEFITYAISKGVAVFDVSNLTVEEEAAMRQNLTALGYPLDDKMDTVQSYDQYKACWGTKWLVIANASYGSWESAPFNHDYKNTPEQQRAMKLDALRVWSGK